MYEIGPVFYCKSLSCTIHIKQKLIATTCSTIGFLGGVKKYFLHILLVFTIASWMLWNFSNFQKYAGKLVIVCPVMYLGHYSVSTNYMVMDGSYVEEPIE